MRLLFIFALLGSFSAFAAESFEQQATETFLVEQIKKTNTELKFAHEALLGRGYEPPSYYTNPLSTKAIRIGGTCNSLAGESQCDLRYLVVTTYNKSESGKLQSAALVGLVSLSSPNKRGTLLRAMEDGELTKLIR